VKKSGDDVGGVGAEGDSDSTLKSCSMTNHVASEHVALNHRTIFSLEFLMWCYTL
jgi:hypothetical protein